VVDALLEIADSAAVLSALDSEGDAAVLDKAELTDAVVSTWAAQPPSTNPPTSTVETTQERKRPGIRRLSVNEFLSMMTMTSASTAALCVR